MPDCQNDYTKRNCLLLLVECIHTSHRKSKEKMTPWSMCSRTSLPLLWRIIHGGPPLCQDFFSRIEKSWQADVAIVWPYRLHWDFDLLCFLILSIADIFQIARQTVWTQYIKFFRLLWLNRLHSTDVMLLFCRFHPFWTGPDSCRRCIGRCPAENTPGRWTW